MGDDNVKVAVRVRPFNTREKDRKSKMCITMTGKQTKITDLLDTGREHVFTFDYSYNSHVPKTDPGYATQEMLWSDIGMDILNNAYNGFNCCLFAYGQTGAGKSYSMMGYGEDKGIIPMACERIFDRVEKSKEDSSLTIKVEVSMLEIYMEKIRDLFNPVKGRDLKVRNNPKTGFYVDNLTSSLCGSYDDITDLMDMGTAARTVASTNMNATSSRAHTVFQIKLTQTKFDRDTSMVTDKTATINLIDLAGSERQSGTGATGDRLKEGAAINLSLTSLGNCISALAKQSNGKKVRIPYRDSKLTMLLQNSLGGNSKTVMIAAVSPADINHDETLSTLRYADRAKQIKNKAVVNEDPNQTLIRNLREELAALKARLGGDAGAGAGGGGPSAVPLLDGESPEEWKERMQREMEERVRQEMVASMATSKAATDALRQERVKELAELGLTVPTAEEREAQEKMADSVPHFTNLHEDAMLSDQVRYFIPEASVIRVGRADADVEQQVRLDGIGVEKQHCVIENGASGVTIAAATEEAAVFVNGHRLKGTTPEALHHNNRVIIGNNHTFRVVVPSEAADAEYKDASLPDGQDTVDWTFAWKEKNQAEIELVKQREAERRAALEEEKVKAEQRLKQFQAKMEAEQAKAEEEAAAKREQFAKKARELTLLKMKSIGRDVVKAKQATLEKEQQEYESKLKRRQQELERRLKEQQAKAEAISAKQARDAKFRSMLEEQLVDTIVKVNEANMMSTEMATGIRFYIKLMEGRHLKGEVGGVGGEGGSGSGSGSGSKHQDEDAESKGGGKEGGDDDEDEYDDDDDDEADDLMDGVLPDNMAWEDTQIFVQLSHVEDARPPVFWARDKFVSRLYLIRQMYQTFVEGGRTQAALHLYTDANDPFYEPPQDQLVGRSTVYLDPLSFLFGVDVSTPIVDYQRGGQDAGRLKVRVFPHLEDEPPAMFDEDDEIAESMDDPELQGRHLNISVCVDSAMGLPKDYCSNTYVRFKFFLDEEWTTSPVMELKTTSPEFKFVKTFRTLVSEDFARYVGSEALDIEVWGVFDRGDFDETGVTFGGTTLLGGGGAGVGAGGGGGGGGVGVGVGAGGQGSGKDSAGTVLERLTRALTDCKAAGMDRETVLAHVNTVFH